MKAVFFEEHGGMENIQVGDLDIPKMEPHDVLIKTKFGGLNHLDLFVLKGWPGLRLQMPHILGSDGSGVVQDIGPDVTTVKRGDRVTVNPGISCGKCEQCLSGNQNLCSSFSIIGENQRGIFAEMFKVPEENILKIPYDYPFDKAAAAPLNFLTAWRLLVTKGRIKENDTVFVHGAGGGVATAAIQIAKLYNATVITTTSTEEKMEWAQEIGADYVLNYRIDPDYSKKVYKHITEGKGVDIVVDSVGTKTFTHSLRMLKPNGRVVTCGATTGAKTDLDIRLVFWKQLEILGSTMSNQQEFRDVMALVLKGKLEPVIDKIFPLEEVIDAELYLEQGEQFGKVLLRI